MNTALEKRYSNLGFDPDALREKYRIERDKRVRDDGDDQFLRTVDDYAHYADADPFVEEPEERDALRREVDILIVGGGFSGMMAAARLKERGVEDILLIESGADFGGTWYWNRYPGSQCDIESYCYLPLLEELGYMPKEKYSYASEIFEHSRRIGEHYGLYDLALFQTRVTELRWSDEAARWTVTTHCGDEIRARVDGTVNDPATAEALKPWYRQFCKRPTFNDEYLATFNRPNVHLVDVSESKGVDRITERGVVANGIEYEVDCIVYATGFEISSSPRRRVSFDVIGRGGMLFFRA